MTREVPINLEELIVKYKPIIGFKVKKALGYQNPEWEDITSEIIANVVEKINKGEFRGESSIGTFIYTITSRRIIDYIREKSKRLEYSPEPAGFPDPHEVIEEEQRARQLAEAIKKLKPKYREVLYLYYYKELSRQEVARKLGISPARVSERVDYAQKLLRKMLQN